MPPDPASEARFPPQIDVFSFSSLLKAWPTITYLIATQACIYFFTVILFLFAFVTTLYERLAAASHQGEPPKPEPPLQVCGASTA
jgi:hypothetical protein